MSVIDIIVDDYVLLLLIVLLASIYLKTEVRTDRIAISLSIGALAAVFVVANHPAMPPQFVLGTAVGGLVICSGAFSAVVYTRVTGREKAA